jgi:hypothetical protein
MNALFNVLYIIMKIFKIDNVKSVIKLVKLAKEFNKLIAPLVKINSI